MKRMLCAALAVITAVAGMTFPSAAQAKERLSGEISRNVRELYPGVELTKYSLGSSSKYNIQQFSTVEFDPKQDDLYFDVTGGGKWATQLYTPSATAANFNKSNGEGKTAIAAVNGDMWMVTYAHARVEGSGTSYGGYSDPVVTKGLSVPRGFTMYDGEIICTSHMVQETPYEGAFNSFGLTSDGEALLGEIVCDITVTNEQSGRVLAADGINRLPANDAFVMYTDRGSASNYALSDAYEVVIDCSYDYTVRQGETIRGTVTALTKSGEEKHPMKENRIILTARGSKLYYATRFKVGDEVSITVDITDNYGNTEKWQDVSNCVGCHMPVIIDGNITYMPDNTRYPASILGIKADGKVVMFTGYGRQSSTGYSYGFKISQMGELCSELGIVTAALLDGGGSAAMVTASDGGYELTGRPSDKFADGSYGKERTVVNSVILSYGEPRTDIDTNPDTNPDTDPDTNPDTNPDTDPDTNPDTDPDTGIDAKDFVFENEASLESIVSSGGVDAKHSGYSLSLLATGEDDPHVQFSYMGADASKYNYLTITARTAGSVPRDFKLGISIETGSSPSSVTTVYKQAEFATAAEWQTLIIRLSDVAEWQERLYGLKISLFDGSGNIVPDAGVNISSIRIFSDKADADNYAEDVTILGEPRFGDANSDGTVSAGDAVVILRSIAKWNVSVDAAAADYNSDESINVRDASEILRSLVN